MGGDRVDAVGPTVRLALATRDPLRGPFLVAWGVHAKGQAWVLCGRYAVPASW